MNERPTHGFDENELSASLRGLGVIELEERLEFSPLLASGGAQDTAGSSACCSCKIPPDDIFDGKLPAPTIDPGPDGWGSTGPTGGLGW